MKNKKIQIIISLIFIILLLLCFFNQKELISNYNILLFNLWRESNNNVYKFKIANNENANVKIDLIDTALYKKIQPGTKGYFDIVLNAQKSNARMIYKTQIKSNNEKPKNLKFNIKGKNLNVENIEELESFLQGKIEKGEKKIITIEWKWEYESAEKNNIQDTIDGQNIKKYNFEIDVISTEEAEF